MGMAAGQARLLSITARLSDNEQNGQALSFAKQRLADEADQVNREYNEALNATKLTVLTGFNGAEAQYTDISYGLLTEYNKLAGGKQYLVTDQRGRILVTEDMKTAYEKGNGDFNRFISYFDLSQNDVDFAAITGKNDDEIKANKAQIVHDAWDKYLTSVGMSFEDLAHDESNPNVQFGWDPDTTALDDNGNVVGIVGSPYVDVSTVYTDQNVYELTFTNSRPDGTAIIPDLPVGAVYTFKTGICKTDGSVTEGSYGGTQKLRYFMQTYDAEGKPQMYCMGYNTSDPDTSKHHWTIDKAIGENFDWAASIANGYQIPVFDSYGAVTNLQTKNGGYAYYINDESSIFIDKFSTPLNFEGSTKEQRELYDYAVALTQAYANALPRVKDHDHDGTLDPVRTVADNPENASEIQYYRNIFEQMQQFGYVTEADLNINQAPSTARANVVKTGIKDNNWFEQGLRQGKLLLKTYDASKGAFVNTTYAEDSNIQEVEDDRRIAKAEIDYTQAQTALERKDKKIDLELKKLDTEHNALQTEYESVKSVVDKNIEKSFNIFS